MESQVFWPDPPTLHSGVETIQGNLIITPSSNQDYFQLFPTLARQYVELKYNFQPGKLYKVGRLGGFLVALYNISCQGGVSLQDCSEDLTERVEIAGDYNNRECGLQISNLTREDSGIWECQVKLTILIIIPLHLYILPRWRSIELAIGVLGKNTKPR